MFSRNMLRIADFGFFMNSTIIEYDRVNFFSLKYLFFGVSWSYFFKVLLKLEWSPRLLDFNFLKSMPLFLKALCNYYLLRSFPGWNSIKILTLLSKKRFIGLRNFKGKSFLLGKPTKGQRTWSNGRTAKRFKLQTTALLKADLWV